ncbi:hypothetical protein NDU88_005210 [Pleurodeles waltl]|uniref:Uncharacterized protein n=1 Tax=Pleurodeles waltl TaxID=8319 RepID=A0AAV7TTM1_PLEWA|nr:hypothetical protein NDU88_005210 [Pleurodeles waltl]
MLLSPGAGGMCRFPSEAAALTGRARSEARRPAVEEARGSGRGTLAAKGPGNVRPVVPRSPRSVSSGPSSAGVRVEAASPSPSRLPASSVGLPGLPAAAPPPRASSAGSRSLH